MTDPNVSIDRILIIDNDQERAQRFKTLLDFLNFQCTLLPPGEAQDLEQIAIDDYAVIFTVNDETLRHRFLQLNQKNTCQYPLVVMTEDPGNGEVAHLPFIAAIGNRPDYRSLNRVLEKLRHHNRRERRRSNREIQNLIGRSRAISDINRMIEQVANTGASVLIMGESGTGKEVIARNIHAHSDRRNKPFVPINCGAIPSELLESELFGHEKGAFTGAISARKGRFELAEGGVIFLDEIGDMPLAMQVKLLRVLQERTYEKIGSNHSNRTDVRVIAATHRPLEKMIEEGSFREDLYYRLNVFPIEVPPLRERREDVPLLIDELIQRIEREKRGAVRLTAKAKQMLAQYDWPGNVRELANLIERLAILHPHDVVDVRDLPAKYLSEEACQRLADEAEQAPEPVPVAAPHHLPGGGIDLKQYLADIEIAMIEQALNETGNVVARAANLLKMRRTTLVEKMRKYEIER
jgi:sigma-54 specific flagellar transcriptional regulator A